MIKLVADPIYCDHLTGANHPEKPERYLAVMDALSGLPVIKPRDATVDEILLCHTEDYLNTVEKEILNCKEGDLLSTGDVQISPESYRVALRAAGGVLTGVDLVVQKKARSVFCVIRPPGHHACSDTGMGFCLFNNIAIGARYAQKKYGIERVLIVDFDVHHGNGTQEIFQKDPTVFYMSTHQDPLYPGTGAADEVGVGNICNVPIRRSAKSRNDVIKAYRDTLKEKMKTFKPQLVMISAGFDAHKDDPLGGFNLTDADYGEITGYIRDVADEYCEGKIVSVLEGGYNLRALATGAKAHVDALGKDR